MSTLTTKLSMSMPDNGDESWGDEIRNAMVTLDHLAAQTNRYYVDPGFTTANLYPNGAPSARRHFHTIQSAITQAEADGVNTYTTICVYPDQYIENLAITKSMTITGVTSVAGMNRAGANGLPLITGPEGDATVSVDIPASVQVDVTLANLELHHQHATVSGTEINGYGQLLYVPDQGAGNYTSEANRIHMYNVHSSFNTLSQPFESQYKVIGNCIFSVDSCSFRFSETNSSYGFMIQGNNGNGDDRACLFFLKKSDVYKGGTSDHVVRTNNNGNIQFSNSTFNRSLTTQVVSAGPLGQNSIDTMSDGADAAFHNNILGLNAVVGYL